MAASPAKGKKCRYCGKMNHYERDCNKKKADVKAGLIPADSCGTPGASPKKKGKNSKGPKLSGSFRLCVYCKNTNHDSKDGHFKKFHENNSSSGSSSSSSSSVQPSDVPKPAGAAVAGPFSLELLLSQVVAQKLGIKGPDE